MTLRRTNRSVAYRETAAIAEAAERAIEYGDARPDALIDVLRLRLERERDAELRFRLARAYLRLLRASGAPVAAGWIRGDDPMLREAAYDVLHELGEDALPALLELAESHSAEIRWYAFEVAVHLHRPSMVPMLIRGLQEDAAGNRWAAGSGLIRAGRSALMPILTALVTAPPTATFHGAARRVLARLEVPHHEDLMMKLLDSLAHGTTTVQSGPIAAELLTALRREMPPRYSGMSDTRGRDSVQIGKSKMATKLTTTIRPAGRSDAAATRALWEECGLAPVRDEEWSALTEAATSAILVAEYEGRIVGSAVATFDGWRAYVYHVAVAEPVRGHDIGHDLMSAAEEYLFALGARDVYAAVHEENTPGLALAVANGYLPEGERVLVKTLSGPPSR